MSRNWQSHNARLSVLRHQCGITHFVFLGTFDDLISFSIRPSIATHFMRLIFRFDSDPQLDQYVQSVHEFPRGAHENLT